ncbi:hypothetical protein [Streptomyces chrestomyceticus]|uniref:hypothetical protein n=1 Tax=Streptomyces chrestomyceticus TaxID=68185 RepID=UPI0033D94B7E
MMTLSRDPYTATEAILIMAVRDGLARLLRRETHPDEPAAPLTAAEQWARPITEHLRDPHGEGDLPMLLPPGECPECDRIRAVYARGRQAEAIDQAMYHEIEHGPGPAPAKTSVPAEPGPDEAPDATTAPPA